MELKFDVYFIKFKKFIILLNFLFLIVFLISCKKDSFFISTNEKIIKDNEGFEITLYSAKEKYNYGEEINVWIEYSYVGDKENVTIWGGDTSFIIKFIPKKEYSYLNFDVAGLSRGFNSYLHKDVIYNEKLRRIGTYNCKFSDLPSEWQIYFLNKDKIILPKGEYEIIANMDIDICDEKEIKIIKNNYKAELKLNIKVE